MLGVDYKNDMERLANSVAHEIKNPLALIKANIQMLEFEDKDKLHKKSYNVVYREIEKINSLIMEFINISKPQEYSFERLSVGDFLDDVLLSVEASAKKRAVDIYYEKSPEEFYINGDYNKLSQVFSNILKNSLEAIECGGKIYINSFKSEGYIAIKIEDDGKGIPEKYLNYIGKPFFTTKDGGSGLGVSISKKIIEDHRGIFAITGIEGRGSTVAITLPEYCEVVNEKNSIRSKL